MRPYASQDTKDHASCDIPRLEIAPYMMITMILSAYFAWTMSTYLSTHAPPVCYTEEPGASYDVYALLGMSLAPIYVGFGFICSYGYSIQAGFAYGVLTASESALYVATTLLSFSIAVNPLGCLLLVLIYCLYLLEFFEKDLEHCLFMAPAIGFMAAAFDRMNVLWYWPNSGDPIGFSLLLSFFVSVLDVLRASIPARTKVPREFSLRKEIFLPAFIVAECSLYLHPVLTALLVAAGVLITKVFDESVSSVERPTLAYTCLPLLYTRAMFEMRK